MCRLVGDWRRALKDGTPSPDSMRNIGEERGQPISSFPTLPSLAEQEALVEQLPKLDVSGHWAVNAARTWGKSFTCRAGAGQNRPPVLSCSLVLGNGCDRTIVSWRSSWEQVDNTEAARRRVHCPTTVGLGGEMESQAFSRAAPSRLVTSRRHWEGGAGERHHFQQGRFQHLPKPACLNLDWGIQWQCPFVSSVSLTVVCLVSQ
jgi:hypothetical protein